MITWISILGFCRRFGLACVRATRISGLRSLLDAGPLGSRPYAPSYHHQRSFSIGHHHHQLGAPGPVAAAAAAAASSLFSSPLHGKRIAERFA